MKSNNRGSNRNKTLTRRGSKEEFSGENSNTGYYDGMQQTGRPEFQRYHTVDHGTRGRMQLGHNNNRMFQSKNNWRRGGGSKDDSASNPNWRAHPAPHHPPQHPSHHQMQPGRYTVPTIAPPPPPPPMPHPDMPSRADYPIMPSPTPDMSDQMYDRSRPDPDITPTSESASMEVATERQKISPPSDTYFDVNSTRDWLARRYREVLSESAVWRPPKVSTRLQPRYRESVVDEFFNQLAGYSRNPISEDVSKEQSAFPSPPPPQPVVLESARTQTTISTAAHNKLPRVAPVPYTRIPDDRPPPPPPSEIPPQTKTELSPANFPPLPAEGVGRGKKSQSRTPGGHPSGNVAGVSKRFGEGRGAKGKWRHPDSRQMKARQSETSSL